MTPCFCRIALLLSLMVPAHDVLAAPNARVDIPPGFTFVSYAGGAVEFAYGPGWTGSEMTVGREILFVLSHGDVPDSPRHLVDGLWIGYQYAGPVSTPRLALRERVTRRLTRATRGRAIEGSAHTLLVAGHPAMLQEYLLPQSATLGPGVRLAGNPKSTPLQGFHVQARMPRGWFELHLVAPADEYIRRHHAALNLVQSLRLQDPQLPRPSLSQAVQAASPVIGSWKALRAKLQIQPNGRITLRFDRQKHYRLDEGMRLDFEHPVRQLAGRFVAYDDILEITWDDGSRRNYRWRLDEGRLFLTDHRGQVSQLQRLFP